MLAHFVFLIAPHRVRQIDYLSGLGSGLLEKNSSSNEKNNRRQMTSVI
ncbi:hypothetical protein EDC52_101532 [Biostraticola tofi]|uniref:Uncharacterized protein n=1 Tax=Biostraticola tofi TaxID=466109 RepID=A0A4R3Z6S1_9GAMM|nr:hypothetical protein EDC52_101532 [Biostraticola tofi]